jgi:primosomal protein N''
MNKSALLEVLALALEQNQKRVVDLRTVTTGDRHYNQAQREIKLITRLPGWEEPALVRVKNIAPHTVPTDAKELAPGQVGEMYAWQYKALARFLELLSPLPVYAQKIESEEPKPRERDPKKIDGLLAKIAESGREFKDLDRMANKAREDLTLATSPGVSLAEAKKIIGEANLTLSFADQRRQSMRPAADSLEKALREELEDQVNIWNSQLAAVRESIEESIIQQNVAFFAGDDRDCRRVMSSGPLSQMPVFALYRAAFFDDPGLFRLHGQQLVDCAKRFSQHVEKYREAIEFSPLTAVEKLVSNMKTVADAINATNDKPKRAK